MKLVLTSALFGAFFLVSGCSTQCESLSTAYSACKLSERSIAIDAENFCGQVDAMNARAAAKGITGCDAKWTAHLQCWQQNQNKICDNTFDGCDQTANDWEDCLISYCDALGADEYDPECQGSESFFGVNVFGPLSLFSPFQSGF